MLVPGVHIGAGVPWAHASDLLAVLTGVSQGFLIESKVPCDRLEVGQGLGRCWCGREQVSLHTLLPLFLLLSDRHHLESSSPVQ